MSRFISDWYNYAKCDSDSDCDEKVSPYFPFVKLTVKILNRNGWTRKNKKDYCPACSAARKTMATKKGKT